MKDDADHQTIDMMDSFRQLDSGIQGMEAEAKRGRKPSPPAERVTDVVPATVVQQASAAATAVALMDEQHDRNIQALALQIGYDGRLEIGAIEDRIRSHMRRTVEECMELGKCLLLLKEMSPHGEFRKRLELFGMHYRVAHRLMTATMKFSKSDSKSLLTAAGSQTKMLELVVLDDGDIEQLSRGESVAGLTLDEIESMSASELRAALRDHKQQLEASRKVSGDYANQVTDLKEKLARPYKPKAGAIAQTEAERTQLLELNDAFQDAHTAALRLATVVNDTFETYAEGTLLSDHARTCIDHLVRLLAGLAATHDINVMPTISEVLEVPAWVQAAIGPQATAEVAKFNRGTKD